MLSRGTPGTVLEIYMSNELLLVKDLKKTYPVRTGPFRRPARLHALNGISLALGSGETLGIAGESGSGKSTLAKLLLRLIPADSGTIHFQGRPVTNFAGKNLLAFRKDVQMVFQDPYASLNPRMSVGETIGEPMKIHNLASGSALRDRVLAVMAQVGLSPDHFNRYPHEFSGGQRQRIGIARALAVDPHLILADEPVSALDLSIQAQIINLLQELKRQRALSFILIAHDLSILQHMCDRIAVLYLGKIVEIASTAKVFSECRHPYTEALLSAVPKTNRAQQGKRIVLQGDAPSPVDIPNGCPFHPRCPYSRPGICTDTAPPLVERAPGHQVACHFGDQIRMAY